MRVEGTSRRILSRMRLSAAAAVAGLVVALVAVPAGAATHRRHAISKAELTQLRALIKKAQKPPVWKAPGPPVKGSVLKGKTLVVFPLSSDIPACAEQTRDFVKIGTALGAHVRSLPSTTGPTGWATNLGDAISDHAAAAIMLCGIENAAVAPQLAQLKAHGIPVVDSNYNSAPPKFFKGIQAEEGVNMAEGVRDSLAQALINLKGKPARILYLTDSEIIQDAGVGSPSSDRYGVYPALKAAIKKWCPGTCKIDRIENMQSTKWSTDGSVIAADLNADHSINTVITPFDGQTDDALTVVEAAKATHPGLAMYAWGGGAAEMRNVQRGTVLVAKSSGNEVWQAAGTMDQVIRLLNHKKPVPVRDEFAPNVFFTRANAATYFAGPGPTYGNQAFGGASIMRNFLKLWEVKK